MKSWVFALAAMAVCGPWPNWQPSPWALVVLCGACLFLGRPRGRDWLAWFAVAVSVLMTLWPVGKDFDSHRQTGRLDAHCSAMLATAEAVATDEDLNRLLSAGGEAMVPSLPFDAVDHAARGAIGRTIYLIDDRGQVIAWGGDANPFPWGVRSLGQRQWGVAWSVSGADLWLREPILIEGRLVGAIVVADRSPLRARSVWGMTVGRGSLISLGSGTPGAERLRVTGRPGVEFPATTVPDLVREESKWRWVGWLLLAVSALFLQPSFSWAVVGLGLTSAVLQPGPVPAAVLAPGLLLGGAAVGRLASSLGPVWSRGLVLAATVFAVLAAIFGTPAERFSWLPDHLLTPGWGGVWMVALAFVASGWPRKGRSDPGLNRRLQRAALLASLGLVVFAARVPVQLSRFGGEATGVVLPRGGIDLGSLVPVKPEDCRLNDFAPVLADRWNLRNWRTPSELRLVDAEGFIASQWGDLAPASGVSRVVRSWPLAEPSGYSVELLVAGEPWNLLTDWRTGFALDTVRDQPIRSAVMTRSGEVAASLHYEVGHLDPETAGELFHNGGGWTWMSVGKGQRPARVIRNGQWLVATISNHPSPSDWVVRAAIGMLWAFLGAAIAVPPTLRRQDLSTFGGRLRLLVAGGVILPLAVLTLFLHQRIGAQEDRLERSQGMAALQAARYTAEHLSGGFAVDDELARWLADGWGGEVSLWQGAELIAVSRPDLVDSGSLPSLPLPETFPSYLLGRDDPAVIHWQDHLVAAGSVELQEELFLLHLFRPSGLRAGSVLGAVDWLLTGAFLSALLALVLTTRIEHRLSSSLRLLVDLTRKLLDGKPMGDLRRPRETDLAEVVDAIGSMHEEVQQRELSLRHQEELLRITLKTLEPAVVVLQPDGTERFANPAAQQLEEEHGGLFLGQLRAVVEEASIGGSAAKTVQPIPGRDLTWRIGVAGVPFPDGSLGLVAVVDDVTDLVRADRTRQLNQMARIVAHEVKNPLTPIRLWVQELEAASGRNDPELPQLLDEACREIADQVARLQETANSFSNLVALEHWEPEPVELHRLLETVPGGSGVFARRGIRFEHVIPSPPPPPVMGDRHWLDRAIRNLVQNSIDALGDEAGTVTLRLDTYGSRVALEVEDTGGGVPHERLSELFSPQFSTTTSGSGLGLALVHQVVTRCHGRVEAANGEHGLRVRIEFPPISQSAEDPPDA